MRTNEESKTVVTVIDAMCGKGKTSWAIQEMNHHKEQSYIYVTPLLDEVERIKTHTEQQFFEPIYNGSRKIDNFNDLLCCGENIATTHSTFANSDDETIEYIEQGNYVLILDEVIDVLGPFNDICKDPAQRVKKGDIKLLKDKTLIEIDDYGRVSWIGDSYPDGKFVEVERLAKRGNLIYMDETLLYWEFPHEVFSKFKNVYILTYLFEGSFLKPFFEYYDISYELLSVTCCNNEYSLIPHQSDVGERQKYKGLINICCDNKLNGYKHNALSKNWFIKEIKNTHSKEVLRIKNNLNNFFRNKHNAPASMIMWTCPKDFKKFIKGKGYTCIRKLNADELKLPPKAQERLQNKLSCFVPCNARATNDYKERTILAYCYNMYANPYVKKFFERKNISVNEDAFALSCLIQWIWRSAIRDSKPINIYIPSPRMRGLLQTWINGEC